MSIDTYFASSRFCLRNLRLTVLHQYTSSHILLGLTYEHQQTRPGLALRSNAPFEAKRFVGISILNNVCMMLLVAVVVLSLVVRGFLLSECMDK